MYVCVCVCVCVRDSVHLCIQLIHSSLCLHVCGVLTHVGYGENLTFYLDWSWNSDQFPGTGVYPSSGQIASAGLELSYPAPTLTALSLKLESQAAIAADQQGSHSFINLSPSYDSNTWVTFAGEFGEFPHVVRVYSVGLVGGVEQECMLTPDPSVVDGRSGFINSSMVVCRLNSDLIPGFYHFVATVSGQYSPLGRDQLFVADVPVLSHVTGCPSHGPKHIPQPTSLAFSHAYTYTILSLWDTYHYVTALSESDPDSPGLPLPLVVSNLNNVVICDM